ncbi:MAG: hypothetical protein AAFX99_10520 [Myxococcota bacterium]
MTTTDLDTTLLERMGTFDRYTCMTVGQATTGVGLYAWYGVLDAGPKDWELDLDGDTDRGIERFRALLGRHTLRYTPPALAATAKGTFSTFYQGNLEEQSASALRRVLTDGHEPNDEEESPYTILRAKRLSETLESAQMRGWLVQTLGVATPILSAPIYVGVSDRVQERLSTHVRQLRQFSHAVAARPEDRQQLLEAEKSSFASRAVGMGFTVDTLEVWVLDIERLLDGEHDKAKLRTLVEAAEWLLNRWHRPLLGRR